MFKTQALKKIAFINKEVFSDVTYKLVNEKRKMFSATNRKCNATFLK